MAVSGTDPNQPGCVQAPSKLACLQRLCQTLAGLVLIVGSGYLLFTNELQALRAVDPISRYLPIVISLKSPLNIDDVWSDRLVHFSDRLHTLKLLHDHKYNLAVPAVKLRRQVEMYQWVEHQESRDDKEDGKTRTKTYKTEWRPELVNSRNFDQESGHENPRTIPVRSKTVVASRVKVGPYTLSRNLVEQIENFYTLNLKDFKNLDSSVIVHGDYFYQSNRPNFPEVGDVRVRFSYAGLSRNTSSFGPAQTVSVIAHNFDGYLRGFPIGYRTNMEVLYEGAFSAEEMFMRKMNYNGKKTWGLRLAGWLLAFLGFQLGGSVVHCLVACLPPLRVFYAFGMKILAFTLSFTLSLIVISVPWTVYRPLAAMLMVVIALLPLMLTSGEAGRMKY